MTGPENGFDPRPHDATSERSEVPDLRFHNALTEATASILGDPTLWHDDNGRWRGRGQFAPVMFAGKPPSSEGYERAAIRPSAAVLAVYGNRFDVGNDGNVRITKCDLPTLTALHERLRQTVLSGEGGRIPRVVSPPDTTTIGGTENTDFWLRLIGEETTWPIMLIDMYSTGRPEPFLHDEADAHLGVLALAPLEMQELITDVSALERQRLAASNPVPVPTNPESGFEQVDPYAVDTIGHERYKGGTETIDTVTNEDGYLIALGTLVAEPAPGHGSVERYVADLPDPEFDMWYGTSPQHDAARGLGISARHMVDLANCKMRMTEQRNLTPAEADAAYQSFVQGVIRVALKIRGEWNDSEV